jgi:hypothetical protein
MKDYIKVADSITLSYEKEEMLKIKDDYVQSKANGKKGVIVRFAATHAGIINKNNFFYLPDKMRKGTHTFLEPYPKPILFNHKDEEAPIGRVIDAKYIDTSSRVKDSLAEVSTSKSIIDRYIRRENLRETGIELIDRFCSGKMTLKDQVLLLRDAFQDSLLSDSNYRGLGYIELVANITEKEAVESFLDERFLTFSVVAQTPNAICSVCLEDWKEARCEHSPGRVYDKKKAYLVAGDFQYEEASPVNKPADAFARTIEVIQNGIKDSYTIENSENCEKIEPSRIYFSQIKDKEESEEMKVKDKKEEVVAPPAEVKPVETVVDSKTTPPVEVEQPKVEDVKTETEEDFITRILDSKEEISDVDGEKAYQLLLDAMKEEGFSEKEVTDAKLSTEKRKGLAKSSFCGPGRSFPVPDCAHVTAARRLIGRYKGNKDGILACVSRKAKAMGCDKAKDSMKDNCHHTDALRGLLSVLETGKWEHDEEKKPLDESDISVLQELITKLAGLVTKDNLVKVIAADKEMKALQDKQLLDEIIALEDSMGKLRDELKTEKDTVTAIREEMELSTKETQVIQDSLIETKKNLRATRFESFKTLKTLTDKTVTELKDDGTLNDNQINSEIESLTKKVDFKKIIDKLDDGTTKTPSGTITNPQEKFGERNQGDFTVSDVQKELAGIKEMYFAMSFKNGIRAEEFLKAQMNRMRAEGKIPA